MLDKSTSHLSLYRDSDLHQVFTQFLIAQLEFATSLEAGLIIGNDPEYNHQYRVTIRRTRSLCLLLHDLIPKSELSLIKPKLRVLMKKTNRLRDLDVFIIDKAKYFNLLPAEHSSLEELFAIIEKHQIAQQNIVSAWLLSNEYTQTKTLIKNSLKRTALYEPKFKPIIPTRFANTQILAQLKKVKKASRNISEQSQDNVIHSLRIKCKALRYLLECFSTLYSSPQHRENIKQIKHLQDKLGDFNDTSNQITFFNTMRKKEVKNKKGQKALKQLIKIIKQQHELSRYSVCSHLRQINDGLLTNQSALETYYQ
ncbi:CHAD domain-containing protein [Vibrio mytili]|uniref:Metal-binding protein n=1 Tax=Vibrio mytili TaxID=50718 RepID=A0A0C3HUR0_9VIBR|nr:CHAD domain-containing protein [Vibrio mytili]KIN11956.1 metal-binding protein [Vibrio mytili]